MQSPHLYECVAFDATKEHIFTFAWNGNQAMGSKITICKNEDNSQVYFGNYTSMKQYFVLPANILENGVCYNAKLEILDGKQNVISGFSNTIVFYCYSTPRLTFSNIHDNSIVENSSFSVILDYFQAEGEPLSRYQIGLYDTNHAIIQSQGIQYLTTPVNQISATITALEDSVSYYVRATGKTLNNMELDTGYVLINAKYEKPSMFSFVDLKNIKSKGCIFITSNLIALSGTSNPPEDELKYINGTMVDLTTEGHYIQFSEGFSFSKNWSMAGSFLGAPLNKSILTWDDEKYYANIFYREGIFQSQAGENKGYFELQVECPLGTSISTTDYIPPISSTTKYTLWITKKNNIYGLIYNEEV